MRTIIALFFSILFTILLVTPTIISLLDDTQEVSVFFDLNEEEENNEGKEGKEGKESKKGTDLKLFASTQGLCGSLNSLQEKKNIRFRSKYYFLESSKIDTPPPKTALIS